MKGNRKTIVVIPILLAAAAGGLALLLIQPVGADQEHWDNPAFWTIAYPILCAVCGILGYWFRRSAWIYGFIAIGIQGLPVILVNLDAELVGVSIISLVVISIPPSITGMVGAWIGRKYGS